MYYLLPSDYLKSCLEEKGIKYDYDLFLSKELPQFHAFDINPKFFPCGDDIIFKTLKFNLLEKEKRKFLLTCHDNIQTNSLKALIKNRKSIEKIKNYLEGNGYECVILEEATVYERIAPNYIETVMISKRKDGYIVSTKMIYSKINKDGFGSLIDRIESDIIFSKEDKNSASDVKKNHNLKLYGNCYLEIMNMILDYQILETILVHSKLSSKEYSLNTNNVIRNFGGTDGIIKLIHNLSELSNQYSIKDYLEPIHLKSNISKGDIIDYFYNRFFNRNTRELLQDMMDSDYYYPMEKNNLFEEYEEEIRIEKGDHSDIWRQVYLYFFEQGCNVRLFEEAAGIHSRSCVKYYPKYHPFKTIEQILEQEYFPDIYGIAYILTKMQKGDFRFISRFDNEYDDIIFYSLQYPQSMIELISRYQRFISYCCLKGRLMLWGKDETVAKEMQEYIFGLFGIREGKMELAKDMNFIYYQLATSNCYRPKEAHDFFEFAFDMKLTKQLIDDEMYIYNLDVDKQIPEKFRKIKALKNNRGNN